MVAYRINFYQNVREHGWVAESMRVTTKTLKRSVRTLAKKANVRCLEVVKIGGDVPLNQSEQE